MLSISSPNLLEQAPNASLFFTEQHEPCPLQSVHSMPLKQDSRVVSSLEWMSVVRNQVLLSVSAEVEVLTALL